MRYSYKIPLNKHNEKEISNINDENYLINVKNISKIFYPCTKKILNCISLGLEKGDCVGILCKPGTGVTTLFRMLTGKYSITDGEVYIGNLFLIFFN